MFAVNEILLSFFFYNGNKVLVGILKFPYYVLLIGLDFFSMRKQIYLMSQLYEKLISTLWKKKLTHSFIAWQFFFKFWLS